MYILKGKPIMVCDIETNSLDVATAKMKWFGAYSYLTDKYYEIPWSNRDEIQRLIDKHRTLVTFNGTEFDMPIIEANVKYKLFKNHIDLYTVSKQRLATMGIKVKDYSLRTIAKDLKLDSGEKGEIDFAIFEKEEKDLTPEEIILIKKYLNQDIVVTKALFEWFNTIFESVVPMLSKDDQERVTHIKASTASLSYRAILNNAGIKYEFANINDRDTNNRVAFEGAHHIEPRQAKVKGNIVSIDFTSMYPHIIMMCNLLTPSKKSEAGINAAAPAWQGNGYIKLKGTYDNTAPGIIETSLRTILLDRLEAKRVKNMPKNLGYKVLINSFYGTLGNNCFKNTYNPIAAGDVTGTARTILKRLAATLEENGFDVLYGFTDNVIVKIPEESSIAELMLVANTFIKDVQTHVAFPQETFRLETDKEMKFIWFIAKNCYLFVDTQNKVNATSTLLNKNTPEIIMKLYNEYICPKIIRDLDVNFTAAELSTELLKIIGENIEITAEDFTTQSLTSYKVKTSLEYQVSEKYGPGKHRLIPNIAEVGVGRAKSTKKKIGVRYCTIEEFKENNLTKESIDIEKMLSYLKPFYKQNKLPTETENVTTENE